MGTNLTNLNQLKRNKSEIGKIKHKFLRKLTYNSGDSDEHMGI
jgi:hypothetical protein